MRMTNKRNGLRFLPSFIAKIFLLNIYTRRCRFSTLEVYNDNW